jgi:hypothetical protein
MQRAEARRQMKLWEAMISERVKLVGMMNLNCGQLLTDHIEDTIHIINSLDQPCCRYQVPRVGSNRAI